MKSVVLLSGGIDSTVLLADRHHAGDTITAVTFDYGQTHIRETDAALKIAQHYAIKCRCIHIPDVFAPSALTGWTEIPDTHAEQPDQTTVPARNLVMLAIGAAIAEQVGAAVVFIGANHDDAAGYLDCRPGFITALDEAVYLGTRHVTINAPYLSWSKAQVIEWGRQLGAPIEWTWSCYRGDETPCGRCGACVSREAATA